MTSSTSMIWPLHELSLANFNDARLTKRAVALATALFDHPHCSIPQACESWAKTKGAYRFFSNDKVEPKAMLQAHYQQLRERVAPEHTILVAQDTMTVPLDKKAVEGLGRIGNGGTDGSAKGLFVHSGLAMTTGGVPLGLTSQKIYVRRDETATDDYKKTIKRKPIADKETVRWIEAVNDTKLTLPDKHIVMIGDRESDIYEVFAEGRAIGIDLLVRTSQNRLLKEVGDHGEKTSTKLFDKARSGDIITTYETDIPIDNHRTRRAVLTIRSSHIMLPPPKTRNKDRQTGEALPAIPLMVLNVQEENPPEGMEAVQWMLTTSLQINPADDPVKAVRKIVQWYIYRWRIERFHYTLKTGAFDIEQLQLEAFKRYARAITLYSILAVRVLHTVYYERDHPDEPARTIFSEQELQALSMREHSTPGSFTIHQAVVATAKLGGYLARRSDGPPGIKALWIGFQALRYLTAGIVLGSQMTARGVTL